MAQLVFRSENSASLWSLKAIHAMCVMEQSKVGHPAPPLLRCTNPPSFQSPTCTKSVFTAPKLNVPPKHYFKKSRCFRKSLLCLTQIRSQAQFGDLCQQHVKAEGDVASRSGCCPSWSLGNYLAVLTNASCCLSLTSQQAKQSLKKIVVMDRLTLTE